MKQEGVDQRITYDPKLGVILKKIGTSDSGIYNCQANDSKSVSSATMVLEVSKRKYIRSLHTDNNYW